MSNLRVWGKYCFLVIFSMANCKNGVIFNLIFRNMNERFRMYRIRVELLIIVIIKVILNG